MKALNSLRSLRRYYKKDWLKLCLLTLTLFTSNLITLLFAALWGFILNYLVLGKFFEAIMFLLLQLIVYIVDSSLKCYASYLQSKIELNMVKDMQFDIFKKIVNYPAVAYEEKGVGKLNARIHNDANNVVDLFTNFINLISRFITALIIIYIFFKIHIILGIEIAIFAIVIFFVTKYFAPKMKKANQKVKESNDELQKDTTQILSGIREVKALGIKSRIFNLTNDKFTNTFQSAYDAKIINISHNFLEWLIYATFEFVMLFTGAFLFYKELIIFIVIVLIYNYLSYIDYAVQSYTTFTGDYQKLSVALKRIDEVVNDKLYQKESFGNKTLSNIKGEIEFNNVSFTYPHDEKATLNELSLKIKPHVKTAIVGASGSGKSSIFNLLLHYFNKTEGEITIDGIPLEDLSEESLRENISVIRQDTFLFNMSIMDNFRMVKEDITLKEVRKACKAAYIDNYIMDLPNGYDSIIGENGVNLSGGQRQRLSIARALIKEAKIILFDEATSALDNKSQEYIKKTIDELAKNHTIVIIAHRLSTIIDADEIILMDNGKVVTTGTHKKLMRNAKYKELYKPDIIN